VTEPALENRYRLLAASFRDGPRDPVWRDRLGSDADDAVALLVHVLAHDLGLPPDALDREHVAALLRDLLPGRLDGSEPYRSALPDLLEDLLLHIAEAAGVARQWEWTSAVDENRAAFERALENPDRPTYAAPRREPDRRPSAKIGRNDPCPCGSGRKYKVCCLRLL